MRIIVPFLIIWVFVSLCFSFSQWPSWHGSLLGVWQAAGEYTPVDLAQLFVRFGEVMRGFIFSVSIFLAAWGLGNGASRIFGIRGRSVATLSVQATFGLSLFALIQHGLSLIGLVYPSVIRVEVIVAFVLGIYLASVEKPWQRIAGTMRTALLAKTVTAIMLTVCLFAACSPDMLLEDALGYHLAIPEQYLIAHKAARDSLNVLWNIPLAVEMISLIPTSIGGIFLAKLMNIVFLLCILGITHGITRALLPGNDSAGWWACAWFLTTSLVTMICLAGKNDLGASMFIAAAVLCFLRKKGGFGLPAAGIWFVFQALAAKLTAAYSGVGIFIAMVVFSGHYVNWSMYVLALVMGAVPLAGWLIANYLVMGNPFYPFLSNIFHTLNWGPEYLVATFAATAEMIDGDQGRVAGLLRHIAELLWSRGSLVLAALLPLAFFGKFANRGQQLKIGVALSGILWLLFGRDPRYLLPLFPLVSALISVGLYSGNVGIPKYPKTAIHVLTVLAVLVALLNAISMPISANWYYFVGATSQKDLQGRLYTTWDAVASWARNNISSKGRILEIGDPRRLGLPVRVFGGPKVHEPVFWRLTNDSHDAGQMRKRLRQQGLTHCLYNYMVGMYQATRVFPGPKWDKRQLALFEDFSSIYMKPVYAPDKYDLINGGFIVYEFMRLPGSRGRMVNYLPSTEGMFAEAVRLGNSGNLAGAIREVKRVGEMMPRAQYWREILASYYWDMKNYDEFEAIIRNMEGSCIVSENAWLFRGWAAMHKEDVTESIRYLSRSMTVYPGDLARKSLAIAFTARARARKEAGLGESAARDLRAAKWLVPGDEEFHGQVWQMVIKATEEDGHR